MNGIDLWQGLDTAQTFEHGTYLMYGAPVGSQASYTLAVQKCIVKASQKSGIVFIVEAEVMVSNCPLDPQGSRRSWVVKLDNPNVAWPNIKGFVYACLGLAPNNPEHTQMCASVDQVIKGIMNLACGERNMLSGAIVNVDVVTILTEKKKEPFNRHQWGPAIYPPGVARPDWSALMAAAPQAVGVAPIQRAQPMGWGAPQTGPTAPGWGVPPPAQTQQWGAPPPAGPPAQPGWGPPGPSQTQQWGAPPPAGPPPFPGQAPQASPPPMVQPWDAPDAQKQNGMYWRPGMPNWLPVPK